jgi:hypothetical protein
MGSAKHKCFRRDRRIADMDAAGIDLQVREVASPRVVSGVAC